LIIDALTRDLMILLTVASLLGAVIGASLWSLYLSRRQKNESTQFAGRENTSAAFTDVPVVLSPADQKAMADSSRTQEQRIVTLEAELLAHEEQQIRLQRDLASQKALRRREQPSLFKELDSAGISDDTSVPVLNKRVDANSAIRRVAQSGASMSAILGTEQSHRTDLRSELADHLESEIEIPALAESELPESVDELVFELDDGEESGTGPGG